MQESQFILREESIASVGAACDLPGLFSLLY